MIVDDCLMRLAGVVSPQPPPRWSHTQEDGHSYEMAYAPEVSSTCRVKSESGDWVTENWGMGTRALSARWVSRLGGPGRAWGGAGETRKPCGEGASSEGHPLAFLPGGGGHGTEERSVAGWKSQCPGGRDQRRLASSVLVLVPAAFEAGTQTQPTIRSVLDRNYGLKHELQCKQISLLAKFRCQTALRQACLRPSLGHS